MFESAAESYGPPWFALRKASVSMPVVPVIDPEPHPPSCSSSQTAYRPRSARERSAGLDRTRIRDLSLQGRAQGPAATARGTREGYLSTPPPAPVSVVQPAGSASSHRRVADASEVEGRPQR